MIFFSAYICSQVLVEKFAEVCSFYEVKFGEGEMDENVFGSNRFSHQFFRAVEKNENNNISLQYEREEKRPTSYIHQSFGTFSLRRRKRIGIALGVYLRTRSN